MTTEVVDVCAATGSATIRELMITKAGNTRLFRLTLPIDTRTPAAGEPIPPSLRPGHVLERDTIDPHEPGGPDTRGWEGNQPSAKIRYATIEGGVKNFAIKYSIEVAKTINLITFT
jgi:hypothetical protein